MLKLATKFAPSPAAFELAYQVGYRHAEFWLNSNLLSNWTKLLDCAREYPFSYVLHFPNQLELDPDTLEDFARLSRAMDHPTVVIHADIWSRWRNWLEDELPETAFAVENHCESPSQIREWAAEHAALTLDVEHLWKFTLGNVTLDELFMVLEQVLAIGGHKLRQVHLPGYLPDSDEHRPMYCSRDLVFVVLNQLERLGFTGQVVSEVDVKYQNRHELEMDRLLFERWRETRQAERCHAGALAIAEA